MAIIGALDKTKHFSEFNEPLFSAEGTITPSARKARAQANLGNVLEDGARRFPMPAPATATATATLTTDQVLNGLLLATPGGAVNYTLPTGSDLDAALPDDFAVGDAFEFNIVNLSATAANDITVVTNTGWTLSGDMVVDAADSSAGAYPQGRFWARKTAASTFTLYRVG